MNIVSKIVSSILAAALCLTVPASALPASGGVTGVSAIIANAEETEREQRSGTLHVDMADNAHLIIPNGVEFSTYFGGNYQGDKTGDLDLSEVVKENGWNDITVSNSGIAALAYSDLYKGVAGTIFKTGQTQIVFHLKNVDFTLCLDVHDNTIVSLVGDDHITMTVGETYQLAFDYKKYDTPRYDPSITSVSYGDQSHIINFDPNKGVISAKAEGVTTLEFRSSYNNTFQKTIYITVLPEETVPPSETVLGDIIKDGKIDVVDLIIMQKYLLGILHFTEEQLTASDINGDGMVDVFDIALLKRILLNQ